MAGFGPLGWLAYATFTLQLGADPVKTIQHLTGLSTLVLLFVTLAVTPLRKITGWNELIRVRRLIGLFAFFYATLHAFSYFVFDQRLSPSGIAADVVKHPWVTVGFTAFVLLIPLALTSTTASIRRLGGRRWQQLHRLIYLSAIGGVLHYLWLVKRDTRPPLAFGAVLLALFALRYVVARVPVHHPPSRRGRSAQPHATGAGDTVPES